MVTRMTPKMIKPKTQLTRTLTIEHTRIDHYNSVGVLVDGATSDYVPSQSLPLQASGIHNVAILTADQIAGRNSCQHYNDFSAGTPPVIVGDCQASGRQHADPAAAAGDDRSAASARTASASRPARPSR